MHLVQVGTNHMIFEGDEPGFVKFRIAPEIFRLPTTSYLTLVFVHALYLIILLSTKYIYSFFCKELKEHQVLIMLWSHCVCDTRLAACDINFGAIWQKK